MARQYAHRTSWRPCTDLFGGVCLRCTWRTLTGANRRALAEHLARTKELHAQLTPIKYVRGEDGKTRRVSQ